MVEPVAEARQEMAGRFPGIALYGETARETVAGAALVVLAVKPQQMRQAAPALAPHLAGVGAPVVLSIAAGIRLADLTRWLHGHGRLVRAISNTPALVGKGISGAFAAAAVDASGHALRFLRSRRRRRRAGLGRERSDARRGHRRFGQQTAYVFYFLEALEAAAQDLGFAAADARKLAYATFAGAVALAEASAAEPAVLRAQVTSKGGTTERALASYGSTMR